MTEQNAAALEFDARLDWKQNQASYMANGITEEQYIKSRRIDVGLDRLEPGAAHQTATPQMQVNAALLTDPANTGFRNEYAAGRQTYMANGISEEQYIRTRRIDSGLDPLVVGGAATN